jgi:polar amino acid transport system substrate-binding protein
VNRAPLAMLYRINAGAIPKDHWIQDPDVGGGRVIGEVCHFIDFLMWLSGSLPRSVQAVTMSDPEGLHDTLSINVEFRNGSIGNICYFANGSKALHKEHIEVYQGGMTGVLSDFRTLRIYAGDRVLLTKKGTLDKGQRPMLQSFLSTIRDGGSPLIPADELFGVTKSTFAILESLRTRRPVDL